MSGAPTRHQSARERLRSKRGAVGLLLDAYMAKQGMDDLNPDWELYAARALDWWTDVVVALRPADLGITEGYIADVLIEKLRHQEVWGRLLKEETDK